MKFLLAAFVFFLALGLTTRSIASTAGEVCTGEKTENCKADEKAEHHGEGHAEAGGHHNALGERMNSLFPEKQKNPNIVVRPTVVKLTSPKFLATVAIPSTKLEWTGVDGASAYHVQVATDPNFKWLVANEQMVKGTSYDVQNLEAGHKYYWRVASRKDENDVSFTKSLFVSSIFNTK